MTFVQTAIVESPATQIRGFLRDTVKKKKVAYFLSLVESSFHNNKREMKDEIKQRFLFH